MGIVSAAAWVTAVALVQSLAQELPYAPSMAERGGGERERERGREREKGNSDRCQGRPPLGEIKEEWVKETGGDRRRAKRKSISRWWLSISHAPEKLKRMKTWKGH